VISGTIYVTGALGLELFGGQRFESHGKDLTYLMLTSCEEYLEMLGIVLFIHTLLKYISEYLKPENISLKISG